MEPETLHKACREGMSAEHVARLIAQGANVNSRDGQGRPPLFYAPSEQVVGVLLANGANINSTSGGTSLLAEAISFYKYDLAEILIRRGADVNLTGDSLRGECLTPLHQAAITPFNFDNDAGKEIETARLEPIARMLIKAGATVDTRLPGGEGRYAGATPLHLAADGKNLAVMKLLIANGADVNARKQDGITPLIVAILARDFDAAALLIDSGACLRQADVLKRYQARRSHTDLTPLHIAARGESECALRVAEFIISNGADLNAHGSDGGTPLVFAIDANKRWGAFQPETQPMCVKMIELLVKSGADPNHRDQYGQSALGYIEKSRGAQFALRALGRKREVPLLRKVWRRWTPNHG